MPIRLTVKSVALSLLAAVCLLFAGTLVVASKYLYRLANIAEMAPPYQTSPESRRFHDSLLIADLHADTASQMIDFSRPQPHGHIGSARLEAGNLGLLTLSLVTETTMMPGLPRARIPWLNPMGIASAINGWPARTWTSNYERGLYFLDHAKQIVAAHSDRMFLITSKADLERLRRARASGPPHPLGILLAVEGLHILDGDLSKLQPLIDQGIRMISLTHAFDNEAAGSSTGWDRGGLTAFGRDAIRIMQDSGVVVDLAHASERAVDETLQLVDRPVVISHTGVKATCDSRRNISDDVIRRLGANGGLIGVGFFTSALCGSDVQSIVAVMRHIRDLIGSEHIALGSDYDGMVRVVFDVGGLPVLTDALIANGFTPQEIRLIMGENVMRVLGELLPAAATPSAGNRPGRTAPASRR